jgi:F0F1-type ATP synthase delta subunit
MVKDYTRAIIDLLATGEKTDQVLSRLDGVLKRRGHSKLKAAILKGVFKELSNRLEKESLVIAVVHEEDAKSALVEELRQLLSVGENKDKIVEIDKTMIGGARLRYRHNEVDASYKSKLVTLYQSITR